MRIFKYNGIELSKKKKEVALKTLHDKNIYAEMAADDDDDQ